MKLGLIACGAVKKPYAARARDLYIGSSFVLARTYVELACDQWAILSSKYGLVMPDHVIEPYDLKLGHQPVAEQREWARRTREQIRRAFPSAAVQRVVVAGAPYRRGVPSPFWCPWDDLPEGRRGTGWQRHWLREQIDWLQGTMHGD